MFLTEIFRKRAQEKQNKACLQAAFDGDFKKALELIDQGVSVNCTGTAKEWGWLSSWDVSMTLGHAAVRKGNSKALTALIKQGLDINIKAGDKPLVMYAIECKQEAMALALIKRGADVSYVRSDLETPLSLAEASGMRSVTQALKAREEPSSPKRKLSP
jgi:ankyrin repeat protein